MKKLVVCLLLLSLSLGLCACGAQANEGTELDRLCAKATTVTLSDGGAEIKGPGAQFEAGVLTISTGGAYRLGGSLAEGRVVVDTGEEKQDVQLILDGVSIRCAGDAALHIRRAGDTDIYTMPDTENRLVSGRERELVADPAASGAALYAEDDIDFHGPGSLIVEGYLNNGIGCKNDIDILGGSCTIIAVNNGLKGNQSVEVSGGSLTITCGNDGIKTSDAGKEGKGSIHISGGSVTVSAGDQGLCAVRDIQISGGRLKLRAEADGLKAGEKSAPGMVGISGGDSQIISGNDAIDAAVLELSGGSLLALGRDKDIKPSVEAGIPCYAGKLKVPEGQVFALCGTKGERICEFDPGREIKSAFLALEGLKQGESYTLMTGTTGSLKQTGTITLP
ncbi:MAG: carbohydrate-binding domain-containing protein [Candidatus Limivicinus sp.]